MAYSTFFSFRIFAEKLLATKTSPVDVEHICVGIYPTSRFLIIFGLSLLDNSEVKCSCLYSQVWDRLLSQRVFRSPPPDDTFSFSPRFDASTKIVNSLSFLSRNCFKHFCVLSLFQNLKYPIDPRPHSHSMSYYSKHTQVCIPFIPIISELFALVQQAQYYLVGVWWQWEKDLYFSFARLHENGGISLHLSNLNAHAVQ